MKKTVLLLVSILCLSATPAMADLYGTTEVEQVGTLQGLDVFYTSNSGPSSAFAGVRVLRAINSENLNVATIDPHYDSLMLPADAYFQGDGIYRCLRY